MLKRGIASLLIIGMILSFGSFAVLAEELTDGVVVSSLEESQPVSADGEGEMYGPYLSSIEGSGVTESPSATSGPMTGSAGRLAFDGTNADGTLDAADGVTTNLVENSSKYNGMAAAPVPETPAPSRYSTARVSLSPDIAGTPYEEAAELLGALGIMVGDAEDGAFRPNDSIIRSEMAKVAVYTVGLEDIAKSSMGSTIFPDVPADHWATGAINVANQQGMVMGDDVGTFRPDDQVLLQEAVAIMVRALGYEPAAEDRGGYPTGYLLVASNNQLFRGLSGTATEPATRGDIAQLVFNALTVNLMEQTGFGSNVSYEVVDKNLLYDRLNVEKGYGQITATVETALDGGSTADEERITIDKNQFLEGDTNAKQLLGYNVLYYARLDQKSDEKTLINVRPQQNKNKVVTANADDIVNITGTEGQERVLEYWASQEDRRSKKATIAADAVYIYNGKFKSSVSNEAFRPASGNVILLDADTNGIFEIVFLNHFTNLVVDTVSEVTGRVTDKYLNGSLVFDKNQDTILYTLVKDGREIEVGDLKEWNVISYTISDDKALIKGYVSDAAVSGVVTEATAEGYRIGEGTTLYKKAASYPNTIALRDRGTFYLDLENKIAAVHEGAMAGDEQAGNQKYGYLVGALMEDGFETTARFRIFTATGETKVFTSTGKMRLNEAYGKEPSAVVDALSDAQGNVIPQMVVYETNSSDLLSALELAADKTASGAPDPDRFTLNIRKDDMIYKSASGKLGSVTIGEETLIFDIPADAGTDSDRFAVRNKGTLTNDTSYDALIYDLQENYLAKVVVITSSVGVTAPESPILVVDHLGSTQNEDYEVTDRVYGWQNGEEVSLLAVDKSVLRKGESGETALTKGDIIQYRTNTAGEIDSINLLFDSNAKDTEFVREVTTDLTTVYGRVTKKFSGSVNMTVNGTVYNFATGDARVYLYDSTRSKADIQVVSPADIEIYEEGNEARLFVKVYDDVVQEMVIVR